MISINTEKNYCWNLTYENLIYCRIIDKFLKNKWSEQNINFVIYFAVHKNKIQRNLS